MLDDCVCFTRGGAVLWRRRGANKLQGDPIGALVSTVLLEERSGATGGGGSDACFDFVASGGASYRVRWALDNARGLVFAAAHRKALSLPHVPVLLERCREVFGRLYAPQRYDFSVDFDAAFDALSAEAEAKVGGAAAGSVAGGGAAAAQRAAAGENGDQGGVEEAPATQEAGGEGDAAHKQAGGAFDLSKLKGKGHKGISREPPKPKAAKLPIKGKPPPKGAKKEPEVLDYSQGTAADAYSAEAGSAFTAGASKMDAEEEVEYEDDASSSDSGGLGGWMGSVFKSVTGNRPLQRADLEPALAALKERLMTKNVAEEIATDLCASVIEGMVGQKLPTFGRVKTAVRQAMEEALLRILTPKRSNEILRDLRAKRATGAPYVMVFIGVNGVGKSTNLAKVAYWLGQNNVKVLLAACDTFRSGAVEQLRTHAVRLGVPLFERGYEKDPAVVAREAIAKATREGFDAVLVDTAGRMQDNEPLMVALSKLIVMNKPDTTLFVGEALVGNDGVDQLNTFNKRLADLHPDPSMTRMVDGILLSKFDTIDDKVGAALSMTYTSGAPILFVGCGQTYTALKSLNVREIVKALLG